jgi:hypothetical protein
MDRATPTEYRSREASFSSFNFPEMKKIILSFAALASVALAQTGTNSAVMTGSQSQTIEGVKMISGTLRATGSGQILSTGGTASHAGSADYAEYASGCDYSGYADVVTAELRGQVVINGILSSGTIGTYIHSGTAIGGTYGSATLAGGSFSGSIANSGTISGGCYYAPLFTGTTSASGEITLSNTVANTASASNALRSFLSHSGTAGDSVRAVRGEVESSITPAMGQPTGPVGVSGISTFTGTNLSALTIPNIGGVNGGAYVAASSSTSIVAATGVVGQANSTQMGVNAGVSGVGRGAQKNAGVVAVAGMSDAAIAALFNGIPSNAAIVASSTASGGYAIYVVSGSSSFPTLNISGTLSGNFARSGTDTGGTYAAGLLSGGSMAGLITNSGTISGGTYNNLTLTGTLSFGGVSVIDIANYRLLGSGGDTRLDWNTRTLGGAWSATSLAAESLSLTGSLSLPSGSITQSMLAFSAVGPNEIQTSGTYTVGAIQVGGTTTKVSKILTNTATLDFASISSGTTADLTITVTGCAAGDSVFLGLPSAPPAGVVFTGFVSAANTVTVRAANVTAGAIDPASATYRATTFSH